MQAVTTIGLDIAKSVFQIHGVDATGNGTTRTSPAGCDHGISPVTMRMHIRMITTTTTASINCTVISYGLRLAICPLLHRSLGLSRRGPTRSAALALPVRRSSARHRNDRGMHRRWRYRGSRSEYRIARPRVGSGRGGQGCAAHDKTHQSLRKHCGSLPAGGRVRPNTESHVHSIGQ
jgi:hypothetical protein